MSIDISKLYVKFPTAIIGIYAINIKEKINEHGSCRLEVIIREEERFQLITSLHINTNIMILYKDKDEEITLFCGCPTNVQIKEVRDTYRATITLSTTTFRLDILKKFRSFQNTNNSFKNLMEQIICTDNKGAFLDVGSQGRLQEYPFIQFFESDWMFLKRISSRIKQVLVVDATKEKPSIFLGLPNNPSYIHKKSNHDKTKYLKLHRRYLENYGGWKEEENISVRFDSTLDYNLCDNIIFNDISLYVFEKYVSLTEGTLIFTYVLKTKSSIKQNLFYNKNILGVSINGKVIAIQEDKMKLHLEIDKSQSISEAYWYTYNTPYSNEKSTGHYCMPQVNDSVKLYIPNYFEENAFIKAVNRLDGVDNPKTQDPSIKYFETIHGKEIKLAPTQLKFTAKENDIFFDMSDNSGINFKSSQDINVYCDSEINLNCKNISLKAKDDILLCTKNSNIIVDKIVHLKSDGGVSV